MHPLGRTPDGPALRADGGRPPRVRDDELLDAIETVIGPENPVATTAEVNDHVPLSRRGLQKRLRQLADDERIAAKPVGSATVWWVPADRDE